MQEIKEIIWRQCGASLDMLRNAIEACPEKLWDNGSQFWYMVYHTLFMTDYYLHPEPENFSPPPPFTMSEMDPSGKMPDRTYTKAELLTYLGHCREKCKQRILSFDEQTSLAPVITYNKAYPALEIVLYNSRHVQHHTAQLNKLIRQAGGEPPLWVNRAL
jgi:hypothetical protein